MDAIFGMIILFPCPRFVKGDSLHGWTKCDGKLLQINANQALFSLLGTTYGGNGTSTFGVPTLKAPDENMAYFIATEGIYPSSD